MKYRWSTAGRGRNLGLWPLLLLLVLVPTACVLWLMNAAVQNVGLAARQRLAEAYRGHLAMARDRLESSLREKVDLLERLGRETPASAAFAKCAGLKLADSVVCYTADGRPAYPAALPIRGSEPGDWEPAWAAANRLEYVQDDPHKAASAYAAIAEKTSDNNLAAQALQAQARCLAQAGRPEEAIRVLTDVLGRQKYRQAADRQGRLISADAALRALQLMGGPSHAGFRQTADRLKRRLSDYDTPGLAAAQRRFLMKEVQSLLPEGVRFPTLAAEDLAERFLDSDPSPPQRRDLRGGGLHAAGLPDLWLLSCRDGRMVALFRTASILRHLRSVMEEGTLPPGVSVALCPPGAEPSAEPVVDSLAAGGHLPDWRLTLALEDRTLVDSTAEAQVVAYLWTGVLVIAATSILAALIARAFGRQLRLTRLKNDLVATVSHELKTPLASMRVLVDTLLDAEQFDSRQTREYLQLVAKENLRLSRLIDNFLAFSRMERNRHAFEFEEITAAEVANDAAEAVRERFAAPGCRFEWEIAPHLPAILADRDALTTAILNLLDNAYKYSRDEKQIALKVYAKDRQVCFEVSDNGVGLSRAASRRVFKPFYQVDGQLSRSGGGCGLGLSIVWFIATEHGGTVRVASRPGHGSSFTLSIPSAAARSRSSTEAAGVR